MEENFFVLADEKDHRSAILEIIRGELSAQEIREQLEKYHDNDIASVFDELSDDEIVKLRVVLGNEAMSDILSYLDDAGEYLTSFDADTAADIIEQMDADDALEVLDDLDEETKNELLDLIEDVEVKEEIELLDSYDEDQFGSKMSMNFIVIERDQTIKKAMRTLIAEAAENDNIYTLFVVNDDGSFYGAVDLKDLIPVISSNHGRLLGVITSKDITDIVDDELGDDYAKLAALGSEEERDEPLLKSMKKRIPWLIILLFLGLAVSAVVGLFEGIVDELPVIVAFQSLILGMAGNVGTQSLAVTVRAIGSEEELAKKEQLLLILKETRIALLNGAALGLISFIIVGAYLFFIGSQPLAFALSAAGCVGLAMCFAMMISGFTGAVIPLSLYRFGVDPAVASGPLITTVNDLVAVVSYYTLAWALLLNFGI